MEDDTPRALGALQVDETKLRGHVDEVVRSSVEETLNAPPDAEADQLCRAQRYERSPERVDTRAGHYERKLETKAGAVTLRMPKLRSLHRRTAPQDAAHRSDASAADRVPRLAGAGSTRSSAKAPTAVPGVSAQVLHPDRSSLAAQAGELPERSF